MKTEVATTNESAPGWSLQDDISGLSEIAIRKRAVELNRERIYRKDERQMKPKMRKTTMKKRFFQAMSRAKKGRHSEMYKWFFHERGRHLGKCTGLYLSKELWGWDVYYDLSSGRFEFRNQVEKEEPYTAL